MRNVQQMARAQRADEDLRLADLARPRIDDGQPRMAAACLG
jgi:hypothetical protein